jgi:hypothetical protein
MSRNLHPVRYLAMLGLVLHSWSGHADDSTASGSPESMTVGQAAEKARQSAQNNRWRNTALAIGVIAFGIVAVIAVGNNSDQDQGCCESTGSCCP